MLIDGHKGFCESLFNSFSHLFIYHSISPLFYYPVGPLLKNKAASKTWKFSLQIFRESCQNFQASAVRRFNTSPQTRLPRAVYSSMAVLAPTDSTQPGGSGDSGRDADACNVTSLSVVGVHCAANC